MSSKMSYLRCFKEHKAKYMCLIFTDDDNFHENTKLDQIYL